MSRKSVLILIAFLLARSALVVITVEHPDGGILTDSKGYLALAHRFAVDGQYSVQPDGKPELVRPPGYPLILVALEKTLGSETWKISLVQVTLSGLTCLLILGLGREVGQSAVGLAGAYLYALSPNVALWSLTVMSEIPFSMGLALISWLAVRAIKASSPALIALVGLSLGLLAYLRPIALSLIPTWGLLVFLFDRRRRGNRQALKLAAALAGLGALAALPWILRNGISSGHYVFSTVPTKTWIGFNLAEVVAQVEGTDRDRALATLDPGRDTLALTLEVMSEHPIAFVKAQLLGVARSLVGVDLGTWGILLGQNDWIGLGLLSGLFRGSLPDSLAALLKPGPGLSWMGAGEGEWVRLGIQSYSLLFSGVLLFLAAVGVGSFRQREGAERFLQSLGLMTVAVLVLVAAAAGQARFRIPAEAYLALLAGYGWRYMRNRTRPLVLPASAVPGQLRRISQATPGAAPTEQR